jgi:adenine-specific DNA-methyltransferase
LDLEKQLYDYLDALNSNNIKFSLSNVLFHKGKNNPFHKKIKKYDIINIKQDYNKVSRSGQFNSWEIIVKNY